ncbi:MAG: helix-turn-helix domain-containing protein [Solirubrobacteraceae bacterium]
MRPTDQFGERLRTVRTERLLTQEQLAEASGVHRTEISLLEHGKRTPILDTIVAVANGLGVSPSELLEGVG